MTDTNKLAELIKKAKSKMWGKTFYSELERNMFVADYLLANGVIVPPCKVGDIVYIIFEGDIEAIKVTYTKTEESAEFVYRYYDAKNKFLNMPFSDRSIGKTVFLTKEEAEAELRKRSEDNA
jgi:hypothetical protein